MQCQKCPWKKRADPHKIKGYVEEKHHCLRKTISDGGVNLGPQHAMACHESEVGKEDYCIGWLMNQLGPGNNIGLRLKMMGYDLKKVRTVGPQHETFEQTLPKKGNRKCNQKQ